MRSRHSSENRPPAAAWQRWSSFGLAVSLFALAWTTLLPWIGSLDSVRNRIDSLAEQGVDPSALYYTDLPAMERIVSRVSAARRANPEAFWSAPSPPPNRPQ